MQFEKNTDSYVREDFHLLKTCTLEKNRENPP